MTFSPIARTALYNQLVSTPVEETKQEAWIKAQEEEIQKIESVDTLTPFERIQASAMITARRFSDDTNPKSQEKNNR